MPVFKCFIRALIIIPAMYLLAVGIAFMIPYFKVSDPEDPRFEPEKFQLIDTYWMHRDYEKYKSASRKEYLSKRKLFPDSTDIVAIDNEMIGKRGCEKVDESKYLKYPPYSDNPNQKIKKLVYYYCPYEWWGLFFYDFSELDYPRLIVRISLDKNDQVIWPPLRPKEK